jgi:HEAT repeat protein
MNRMFRFEMAVRTGLIMTLALAIVFAAGCRKKQDKSPKTPPAPVSSVNKTPKQDAVIKAPVAESNQNAVAVPVVEKKDTIKTSAKEVIAPTVVKDNPLSPQVPKPNVPELADLKPFESLKIADEKIDFITEYADEHPESAAMMVYKVLDDNDVEVRTAAMEMLAMKELDDPNIVYVAAKALKDNEPQIRQSAVEACTAVTDPAVGNVLTDALNDSSEEVRTAAIQVADQKEPAIRISVLKEGIASQYEDVKENAVSSLIDASSPAAMDVLITGLKDANPDFRDSVKSAINFLVSQEFDTYDQAIKWWNANRNKYDDELTEKD